MENYTKFIIPALIFLGIGLIILIGTYFSSKNRILRQLKKMRRKPIYSVRDREYVKIIGKAKHAGEPLIAPLSKRKCVYYDVKVEQKGDKSWHIIIDDILFQDFYIQEGSDHAIIQLNKTRKKQKLIHLVTDHTLHSGTFKEIPREFESYLKKHGKKSKGFLGFNKTLRYTERIIELDEEIAAMGIGKWTTIDTPIDGYSDSRILSLAGTEKQKLLITDEPKGLIRVKRKL